MKRSTSTAALVGLGVLGLGGAVLAFFRLGLNPTQIAARVGDRVMVARRQIRSGTLAGGPTLGTADLVAVRITAAGARTFDGDVEDPRILSPLHLARESRTIIDSIVG